MKTHQILSHTADVRLKAEGSTLEELFCAALEGMAQLQKAKFSEAEVKIQKSKVKIKVTASDVSALLVDFLSETLAQSQIGKTVFDEVKFTKLSDTHSTSSGQAELEAEISGERVEGFGEDIKAVTYHGAEVVKNVAGDYEVTILFDI